jgi:hypothetical protein
MWTREWPKVAGKYWFYGWCFRDRHQQAKLHYVEVKQGSNSLFYVTNGHFLYKSEGGYGYWREVDLPDLPEIIEG